MTGDNKRTDISSDGQWHLDKRVPIALILALVLQSTTAVWWAAGLTSQVERNQSMLDDYQANKERVTRLEIYQESILRELKGLRSDLGLILEETKQERRSNNGN